MNNLEMENRDELVKELRNLLKENKEKLNSLDVNNWKTFRGGFEDFYRDLEYTMSLIGEIDGYDQLDERAAAIKKAKSYLAMGVVFDEIKIDGVALQIHNGAVGDFSNIPF